MRTSWFNRILALLLLLALLFALGGCNGAWTENTEPTGETEQETEPVEERPAEFGLSYVEEYGFNPYKCTCLTNRPVISLVYESLFVVNENFQPEPVLCDKFGVSDDGMTYLISICKDACFSDGSPVTAQDVIASLRKASNSAYYGDRFHFVRSFSACNDKTVKIELYTPYENLPLLLDVAVCKNGTQDEAQPIGSGPFYMTAANKFLMRNKNWWQGNFDVIDGERIRLQAAEKPIIVRDNFEFGTTKLVLADPNSAASVGYRCDYELWNCNTTVMQYIGFNLGRATFADADLRQAVTYLIDREEICSSLYNGFAMPASLPCSPQCGTYDKELAARYAYAPEEFSSRIQGKVFTTTVELVVWSADFSRVELANYLADAFARYGIKVRVVSVDYNTYKDRIRNGNFDMFIGEVRLSNDFNLSSFFSDDGDLNFGYITHNGLYNQSKDALANSGNAYDLYQHVMETGLVCPVLFKSYAVMATRGSISTLQPAVDCVFHLPGGRTLADASTTYEALTGQ